MKYINIDKKNWANGLENLYGNYKLFGPVRNNNHHSFKELAKGELSDFNYLNTRLSPKSIVFPQSETMFEYSLDESKEQHHILKEINKEYLLPQALIGIRPCDAASFLIVKRNFDTPEYKDIYWMRAYDATIFIGLACSNPHNTCFCTSAGCGPFHEEGLDLLLVDEGENFIAKILTPKGKNFIKSAGWETETDSTAAEKIIKDMKIKAEEKIASFVSTDQLKNKSTGKLYDAPFWDDIAFACINCGTCTYSCPTCWCFDIQDEVSRNSGIRMRNWDSCMFPLFTLHGTGYNPRNSKMQRVRQRFMHKFKYYVDKYDAGIQCVGCGRCIRLCPANIDIRKVCNMMNNYEN
ncbi:MAG: 4Fe-4S dicluster domain-containing protein [Desulfobacterales bacterium]|nr:4Fe-4S dicluster domain-containing protein [Desulfobacterales bacterium]